MKVEQLEPCPSIKFSFKYDAHKYIPKLSGCYVLATFSNDLLYVGLSNNLYNRFQQHLGNFEKIGVTEDGKAVWFYCLEADINTLHRLERTWLNQYEAAHGRKPILNKINSPLV